MEKDVKDMLHIDVNQQKEVFVSSVDVSFKKQIN